MVFLDTMSRRPRRIDPTNRSAKAFWQGDAGAIGLSRIPLAQSAPDHGAEDAIPIADEIAWSLIVSAVLRPRL